MRTHKIVNFLPPPELQGPAPLAQVLGGQTLAGQTLRVRVIGAFFNSLRGELLPGEFDRASANAAREAASVAALPAAVANASKPSRLSLPVLGDRAAAPTP